MAICLSNSFIGVGWGGSFLHWPTFNLSPCLTAEIAFAVGQNPGLAFNLTETSRDSRLPSTPGQLCLALSRVQQCIPISCPQRVKDPAWWSASYLLCSPTVCPPLLLPSHQCAVVHTGMLNGYHPAIGFWWNFMFSWKTPKLPEIRLPSHISIAPYASWKDTCFFHHGFSYLWLTSDPAY